MKIKDPIEKKRFIILNVVTAAILMLFPAGGYLYGGLDFAKSTLIGCSIVAINFFVSEYILAKIILEKQPTIRLLSWYLAKLGASVVILFLAVNKWNADVVGLMLGLSSMFVSAMISSALKPQAPTEES